MSDHTSILMASVTTPSNTTLCERYSPASSVRRVGVGEEPEADADLVADGHDEGRGILRPVIGHEEQVVASAHEEPQPEVAVQIFARVLLRVGCEGRHRDRVVAGEDPLLR